MTRDEVQTACRALDAEGIPVTIDTVHAHLGFGTRSMVRQHLTRLAEATTRQQVTQASAAQLRQYRGRPLDMRTTTPIRAEEAARVEAQIRTARAAIARVQAATPPPAPALEEEPAPETKEARRRKADLTLARSLLAEAVPWLGAR
jgi:hypothetical protein